MIIINRLSDDGRVSSRDRFLKTITFDHERAVTFVHACCVGKSADARDTAPRDPCVKPLYSYIYTEKTSGKPYTHAEI